VVWKKGRKTVVVVVVHGGCQRTWSGVTDFNQATVVMMILKTYLINVKIFFTIYHLVFTDLMLLVGRQEGHLVCKNCVVRYWRAYLSGVMCK